MEDIPPSLSVYISFSTKLFVDIIQIDSNHIKQTSQNAFGK